MDVTQDGVVSVWLSPRIEETQFAAYLEQPTAESEQEAAVNAFARDFAIGWLDHDFLEACFEPAPLAVDELLAGVSFGTSFIEAVAQASNEFGLTAANAAILLYDCNYQPDAEQPAEQHSFTFVGSFPYDPEAE